MPNRATGVMWGQAPGEAGEPSGGRTTRSGLSVQAIVDTAIGIADVDGLEAVSIRRVAAILDVRPMSLYTHIVSKDELLDLMANELVGMLIVEEPLPDDWREGLSQIARRAFTTFVSHPWILALFTRCPRPGPNAARHAKQMASTVENLGLPPEDVWRLLGIVNDYVLGNALRVATSGVARALEASLTDADREARPEFAALPQVEEARLADEGFEIGLQAVLDGVEHRFVKR